MQVFYIYVDNFVDQNNKRESYFYASFWNCGMLKTRQAPSDGTVLKRFFHDNFIIFRRRS